ncbi:ATP synthase subunit I [Endozoicomonadaceae bacterium StTr2]
MPHLQKPPVYRVVFVQAVMTVIIAAILLPAGHVAAYSALLGGMICVVPNIWMVRQTFRYTGARAAKEIINSFYKGGAGKFLLTIAAFILVFTQVKPLNTPVLFGMFMLGQAVYWVAPFLLKVRRPQQRVALR